MGKFVAVIKKIFGTKNERELKRLRPMVAKINEIEASLQSLSDDALRQKTADWKARLSQIKDNDELKAALNEILPEAFALVKNACRRLLGTDIVVRGHTAKWDMVPFDVQLIGGMALHQGKIALWVDTEYLHIVPERNLIDTDKAISIVVGNKTLRATGLEIDNNARTFKLLSNVRSTYVPAKN